MVAKEWRDAWWKFAVGAFLFLALAATNLLSYEQLIGNIVGKQPPDPEDFRRVDFRDVGVFVNDMLHGTFEAGRLIMALLAAALGVNLMSDESARGTLSMLLSRPISRTRVLLVKYGVGAAALFAVTLLGNLGLVLSAFARGYPLDTLSFPGIAVSTVLMWLGSLSILGVALLCSLFFKNVLLGATVTLLAVYLAFLGPQTFVRTFFWDEYNSLNPPWQLIWWFTPTSHWSDVSLYSGESLATPSLLISLFAAAIPLMAALWIFNRKSY